MFFYVTLLFIEPINKCESDVATINMQQVHDPLKPQKVIITFIYAIFKIMQRGYIRWSYTVVNSFLDAEKS